MDELDFLNGLQKEAGAKDTVKDLAYKAKDFVSAHKHELMGGAAGALAAGGMQYAASRPNKDGLSAEQKAARELIESLNSKKKQNPSFSEEMSGVAAKSYKDTSDVFAKHPGKAAILVAPAGAAMGSALVRLFKK